MKDEYKPKGTVTGIGGAVTAEEDGQPDAAAAGDEDDGLNPDDLIQYNNGGAYYVKVNFTNTTGNPAQLVGWIDYDGRGLTDDTRKRSLPGLLALTCSTGDTSLPSGAPDDGTFETGNVPGNCGNGTAYLHWSLPTNLPVNAGEDWFFRFRLTSDGHDLTQDPRPAVDFFSNSSPQPFGSVTSGEVEDYMRTVITTPITLGHFNAIQGVNPGEVEFTWQTVTEVGNLGFNLYVREGKKGEHRWRKVNSELIPSQQGDSVETQTYSYTSTGVRGRRFALGDVDVFSKETLHGPFRLGKELGLDRSRRKATDWKAIKAEKMEKREARKAERSQRLERKLQRQLNATERQKLQQILQRESVGQ